MRFEKTIVEYTPPLLPRGRSVKKSSTRLGSWRRSLPELAQYLHVITEGDAEPSCKALAKMGLAYFYDPWDATPDKFHRGLDEDAMVIGSVIDACRHSTRKIPGFPVHLEPLLARAHELIRERPVLARQLGRWVSVCGPKDDYHQHAQSIVKTLRQVVLSKLNKLSLPGRDCVDWLSLTPATLQPVRRTIALYGRTACGKTTLMRRLIVKQAPKFAGVAEALEADPSAHTTRIPVIVDFRKEVHRAKYALAGPGGAITGYIKNGKKVTSDLKQLGTQLTGKDGKFSWGHLVLPSPHAEPLRLMDLPGTRGFQAGPWQNVAEVLLENAGAVVLPLDQRFFRSEEHYTLKNTLNWFKASQVCFALRCTKDDAELARTFVDKRVRQGLLDDPDEGRKLSVRASRICVFQIAKNRQQHDDTEALLSWIYRVKTKPLPVVQHKLLYEIAYPEIVTQARGSDPRQISHARSLLVALGLLRAWLRYLIWEETNGQFDA